MQNKKLVSIIVLVVVAGAAFWGGSVYGKNSAAAAAASARAARGGQFGAGGGGRGGMGGFTTGKIIASDATSITVQLQNGGSKIIFLGSTTAISKSVGGTPADLTTGTNVVITGAANSDGSINATMVQIRPAAPSTTPSQ